MWFPFRLTPIALLALACSAPERPPYEIDCDPDVELRDPLFGGFVTGDEGSDWYSFGDLTPGAFPGSEEPPPPEVETLEDGERCGNSRALVLRAHGHNDWGCGFGTWNLRLAPANGTDSDGLALWARSPGATDKSVILNVHDLHTSEDARPTPDPDTGEDLLDPNTGEPILDANGEPVKDPATQEPLLDEDGRYVTGCHDPEADLTDADCTTFVTDAEGQMREVPCGGEVAGLNDCGNAFRRVLTTTDRWQLYLLPWDTFYQQALPNRRPHGIDPSAIHQLLIIVPRESHLELWLDDISFYPRR